MFWVSVVSHGDIFGLSTLWLMVLHPSSPSEALWCAPGPHWSGSPGVEVVDEIWGQEGVLEHLEDINQIKSGELLLE